MKNGWWVGGGVLLLSGLLAFWFLPERGQADLEFARDFSWIRLEGMDAVISAGEDLPEMDMLRAWERMEASDEK